MPFPCRESWEGSTRPSHSPSSYAIDWNRDAYDLGKPVVASAPGVVTSVVNLGDRSYGLYIVVDHGGGWSTLYAHLSSALVVTGQVVDQGQVIARLGSSGNSTGPHLHFEQRLNRVDRHAWFNGRAFKYDTWLRSRACVDVPVAGDWNGDLRSDVGTFSRSGGAAVFRQRLPGATTDVISWGTSVDQPLVGDWNGDGQADVGVRNPLTGRFALSTNGRRMSFKFGNRNDVPISGDWDGDGRWDVGVYDTRSDVFFLRNAAGNFSTRYFAGDGIPVTGDWDGDGRWGVGLYDPAETLFSLARNDGSVKEIVYGTPTSLPVVGFWNAGRRSDVGVWDTATGRFSQRLGPSRTKTIRFGNIR
jgi:hypothetical protein